MNSAVAASRGAFFPLLLALLATLSGCGRTLAEDDCHKIADHLREVWQSEAKTASPPEGADRASAVIKSEGDKLVADWTAECKKELLGRRVESKEIDCLLAAKTIAQVTKCSEP